MEPNVPQPPTRPEPLSPDQQGTDQQSTDQQGTVQQSTVQQSTDQQGTLLPIPDPEESRRLLAGLAASAGSHPAAAGGSAPAAPQTASGPQAPGPDSPGPHPGAPPGTPAAPFRSGFVALIGRPNVGKSTLLNQLVGQKVAITSPVAQTTRNRLRAILTTAGAQLVLLDTPGIHKPHHLLGQRLVQSARGAIGEVDVVLLLVDGSQPAGRGDAFIVELLRRSGMPVMVALNKWDQVDPARAEELIASYRALLAEDEVARIAATREAPDPAVSTTAAGFKGRPSAASDPSSQVGADASASGSVADQAASSARGLPALAPPASATDSASGAGSAEDPAASTPGVSASGGTASPARDPGTGAAGAAAAAAAGSGPAAPSDSPDAAAQPDSPWQASCPAAAAWPLFPVSALTGEGTEALVQALSAALPQGPHLYPPDAISDQPEQLLLAELIREQVLQHTREEVPHSVAVMIDRIALDGPRTAVLATVLVERSSQKGILIGKGGSMLRTIGQGARLQMQKLISGPVYLELFVKVVPGWRSHPGRLAELGYRGD